MYKIRILLLSLTIGFISCKDQKKEDSRLHIAKQYYKLLASSDPTGIEAILTDTLLTLETEYNYEQTFSLEEYLDWLKWDAVFDPTYEILEIQQEEELVIAKVSKFDKRISFLHKNPIVIKQILRFKEEKITTIETFEYLVFNDSVWIGNRESLVNWIDKKYPELNGFLYDQTEKGGLNYLKAMQLYSNQ
ncbi:hypothetical protein [Eudoraea chungangensis]|uniref:hypothetical protein n=1 Tax=Eudoraea chungangensis TaxID=1481905 RepID=UPI0023EE0EB7|nr:hypothetical protein [Eudoraea chungangensis]